MKIDLQACFPIGCDGKRKPLPKQSEFLKGVLDQKGPKFLAYCGGIGSGKTLIGCISMLSQGILYGGEYLIGRQYAPELKATTYKTFLEICPPELIVEHRIAEMTVTIKSASGKPAIYYFRQLEEPDKHRSLNLSGFYVDEANQISEAAFLLLQGRLRNQLGLRKGILTSNVAGHDWMYHYFVKQDMFTSEEAKNLHKLVMAPTTENIHLPPEYVQVMLQTWSNDRIRREIFAEWDVFQGQVYSEFRRDVHVVKPFKISDDWPRIVGIDHGYRNPAAWVWGAVDPDGSVYIYREFYQTEWLVSEIVNGNDKENKRGVMQMQRGEKIDVAAIDPSVRNRSGVKGESILDEYLDHLPKDFPIIMANNKKELGIDRVKRYLKLDQKTGMPMLFIFDSCPNLIEEIVKYRYSELKPSQVGKRSEKEEPTKVDDHAVDALRYLVMTRPEPWVIKEQEELSKSKYSQLQKRLLDDLDKSKGRRPTGPLDSV